MGSNMVAKEILFFVFLNFEISTVVKLQLFEIDISLESEIPQIASGYFDFNVSLCGEDQDMSDFVEAFKQFSKFEFGYFELKYNL